MKKWLLLLSFPLLSFGISNEAQSLIEVVDIKGKCVEEKVEIVEMLKRVDSFGSEERLKWSEVNILFFALAGILDYSKKPDTECFMIAKYLTDFKTMTETLLVANR